jgi:hypothetical protein
MNPLGKRLIGVLAVCALVLLGTSTAGLAQLLSVPSWVGNLVLGNVDVTAWTDPVSTQEELPGLGHKFELLGVMVRDTDPENPVGNSGASGGGVGGNETISATMTPTSVALAFRNLPPALKSLRLRTNSLSSTIL